MNKSGAILVLGPNSFSGSVFAEVILNEGKRVVGINRSHEVALPFRAYSNSKNLANMQIFELGSNYDPATVVEICEANKVEIVVNFAAQSMVAQSWDSPWDWYQTNCVWLSRLTYELMKWGGLKKFVHYTTPEVYGSTSGWIDEEAGINPTTPYAISRAAGDLHLLAEFRRSGFPVIFTRAANVYGPFQQRYRILPKALIAAATRQKIELHGGGHSERSFIFMEDVAHALLLILKSGNIGASYHISTQRLVTIRKAVEMCFQIYGIEPTNYLVISEDRPGKDKAYMLDSNKIRRELGWVDNVSLEEGIKKTRQWVDRWLDLLVKEPSEYVHKA